MSTGISWTSPVRPEIPSRISSRKPEETETAIIITRNEIAMETIAIFPPKRRRLAMKLDASIRILPDVYPFALGPPHMIPFLDPESIEEGLEIPDGHVDTVDGK